MGLHLGVDMFLRFRLGVGVTACPSRFWSELFLQTACWIYDALGQVISGQRSWSDNSPVAGQQFEYTFDDMGNRRKTGSAGNTLRWDPGALVTRRKSDPARLAMAARLRIETTLSIKAIAARVHLGTSKSANARLHQWMSQSAPSASAQSQLGI